MIFGYTRNIFRLSKEAERQKDLSRRGVAVLFLASEYLPAAMRKELKRIWNCDIRTHYGLTEMGLASRSNAKLRAAFILMRRTFCWKSSIPRRENRCLLVKRANWSSRPSPAKPCPSSATGRTTCSRLILDPCPCGQASLLKIDTVKKRIESIATIGDGDEI